MMNKRTYGVYLNIQAFLAAHYSTGTDVNVNTPVLRDNEFDVADLETYRHLLSSANYSIVIHDEDENNLREHPHGDLRIEYLCSVTFLRKTANQWDPAENANRAMEGSDSLPYMNSVKRAAALWQKYVRLNRFDDGDVNFSHWQDVTRIHVNKIVGDFVSVTCSVRALYMDPTTISVTPV